MDLQIRGQVCQVARRREYPQRMSVSSLFEEQTELAQIDIEFYLKYNQEKEL